MLRSIVALSAYISQLATKLAPHGVAFLHHSNSAECADEPELQKHARDKGVRRVHFVVEAVRNAGLAIVCQEYAPR